MRLLLLLALLVACGGSKNHQAVEQWANHDMPRAFARMAEGTAAIGPITSEDFIRPDIEHRLMRAHVALVAAEAEAKKVTPTADLSGMHAGFIRAADDLETDVRDMAAAVAHHDPATFRAAHANLRNSMATWKTWQDNLTEVLSGARVTLAPPPALPALPDEK